MRKVDDLFYPELSYKLYGIGFDTHNQLGRYKTEKQYADLFEYLLQENDIKYVREKFLPASFENEGNRNKPDFLIDDLVLVDLKAKLRINKDDYFQMRRYLEAADKKLGIIMNFRQYNLRPKRVLNSKYKH